MLYLHKNANDPLGERIKEALLDMSAAHKQIDIDQGESFLRENETEIKGAEQVFKFLRTYQSDLSYTQSLGADACLVRKDGGGKVC
ncbi:hypothetical protein [Fulvivirga lutimaris]|uniref:hypothetical protein n=1 Tax=Fulvivirga lutimaris TaxID=1819566 RepID=UPI0012BC487E|nr:hypothetical protein [Fulvivirga lutimaris]MTI39673.1 hypothetical protein [Fulvivirga lutimaris]